MSSKLHTQKVTRPSKSSTIFLVAGLGVALIFGVIGWNIWQNSRASELPPQANIQPTAQVSAQLTAVPEVVPVADVGIELGKVAPDFSVPTLDGKTFTLSEQGGKPTVVFFMAYWCGSCIPEATALGKLKQAYGDKISIVAVNIDPSATWETIEQFKQAAGSPPLVWASDFDQKVTLAYAVQALDTTLILDHEGRVVYRDETPTQYEMLKIELEKLLQ
jgi:thiol-disulfide isomerase/thioredoxin